MDYHQIFGIIAGLFAFTIYIPYIYSIIQGKTKPNIAGWLLYEAGMILIVASSWKLGIYNTVWAAAVHCIMQLVVIALSLRYGYIQFSRFDIGGLSLAVISIGLWIYTNNPLYALVLNILVDAIGSATIAWKTYKNPGTETPYTWGIALFVAVLNTIAMTGFSIEQSLLPLYLLVSNSLILFLALRKPTNAK